MRIRKRELTKQFVAVFLFFKEKQKGLLLKFRDYQTKKNIKTVLLS